MKDFESGSGLEIMIDQKSKTGMEKFIVSVIMSDIRFDILTLSSSI